MIGGENLRRLTSLRSVATKLLEFAQASGAESNAEWVQQVFCRTRLEILLAIEDRRPDRLAASVVEISKEGLIYLPASAWTREWVKQDWPGSIQLEVGENGFSKPSPGTGLVAYCIWSNSSADGRKGVAVVHDVSHPSRNIEFLIQNELLDETDEVAWHTPQTVGGMYRPGRVRRQGASIAAPIFVQYTNERGVQEQTCVGAVSIAHPKPGHFCTPENYVWAQECGVLLGLLYSVCHRRLYGSGVFTDWHELDHAIANGTKPRPSSKSARGGSLDLDAIRADLAELHADRTWEEIARALKVSVRTLRKIWNPGTCTPPTAKSIAVLAGRRYEDYLVKSTG